MTFASWKKIVLFAFVFVVVTICVIWDADSSESENSFKYEACNVYTQTRNAETTLFAAGFKRSADYEQQMATAHAALTHLETDYTENAQQPTILDLHIYQDQIGVAYDATKNDNLETAGAKPADVASNAIQAAASVRVSVITLLGCTPLEEANPVDEANP